VNAPIRATNLQPVVLVALAIVYVVWGSTYLAIRFALEGYPPLFFPALRFLAAGCTLYAILRFRGYPNPTLRQWRYATLMGLLLLNIGNGAVVYAERSVGSALAATAVATVTIWTALWSGLRGEWPRLPQWLGIGLGFVGVVLLNLRGDFAASPGSALLLLASPMAWSFGSVWGRGWDLPKGLMSGASQMLAAGVLFLAASAIAGESWQIVTTPRALGALLYLAVFGSLIAFSAYMILVQRCTPALASSYAYVNPVIALLLGAALGGEHFVATELLAFGLVLAGVVLMVVFNRPRAAR
jgi:drug/metabolite transporter (DMT)-like permease